jgi:hypothetical protein
MVRGVRGGAWLACGTRWGESCGGVLDAPQPSENSNSEAITKEASAGEEMKTVIGRTGIAAIGELASRLHSPGADALEVEVGHTPAGAYLIILTDRDFKVLLTIEQAQAALRALQNMVREKPELHSAAIEMMGAGLATALDNVPTAPNDATVH